MQKLAEAKRDGVVNPQIIGRILSQADRQKEKVKPFTPWYHSTMVLYKITHYYDKSTVPWDVFIQRDEKIYIKLKDQCRGPRVISVKSSKIHPISTI